MKSNLKTIMLNILLHEKLSGYELAKRINDLTCWKPSCGSIYPFLKHAEKEGWVVKSAKGRKNIYSITQKGRQELKEHLLDRQEFIARMAQQIRTLNIRLVGQSMDDKFIEYIIALFDDIAAGKIPMKGVIKNAQELKFIILKLNAEGKIEPNKKRINSVLEEAIAKLKKI